MSYLDREQQIIAVIQARLPAATILGSFAMVDFSGATPLEWQLRVRYADYSIIAQQEGVAKAKLDQRWMVEFWARVTPTFEEQRAAIGAAMNEVLKALLGWVPSPGMTPTRLIPPDEPSAVAQGGVCVLTLGFAVQQIVPVT